MKILADMFPQTERGNKERERCGMQKTGSQPQEGDAGSRGTLAADMRILAKCQHWAKAGNPRTGRDLSKVRLFRVV